MSFYSLFKAVVMANNALFKKSVVAYVNSKLRPNRKLPFILYLSEDSTNQMLVFRVVHKTGQTANRVVVTIKEPTTRRYTKRQLHIDASDGSNWHHLRFEFLQWLRRLLEELAPDKLIPQ
jgi:hypothetical protein